MKPEPPPPPPPKKEKKKPKPVAAPVKKKNKKKDKKKDPKFENTGKIMARKVLKKKGDSQTPPVSWPNLTALFDVLFLAGYQTA